MMDAMSNSRSTSQRELYGDLVSNSQLLANENGPGKTALTSLASSHSAAAVRKSKVIIGVRGAPNLFSMQTRPSVVIPGTLEAINGMGYPLMASSVPGMTTDGRVCIENKLGAPRTPMMTLDFLTAAAECEDARLVKAVLPGPFSFAKSCELDTKSPYSSRCDVDLLFDIASIIRFEIEALK